MFNYSVSFNLLTNVIYGPVTRVARVVSADPARPGSP